VSDVESLGPTSALLLVDPFSSRLNTDQDMNEICKFDVYTLSTRHIHVKGTHVITIVTSVFNQI